MLDFTDIGTRNFLGVPSKRPSGAAGWFASVATWVSILFCLGMIGSLAYFEYADSAKARRHREKYEKIEAEMEERNRADDRHIRNRMVELEQWGR